MYSALLVSKQMKSEYNRSKYRKVAPLQFLYTPAPRTPRSDPITALKIGIGPHHHIIACVSSRTVGVAAHCHFCTVPPIFHCHKKQTDSSTILRGGWAHIQMQLPIQTLLYLGGGAVHESLEEPDSPERNTARLVLN